MTESDVKWNGEFGEKCNLPIDCVDCDIIECPGRPSEHVDHIRSPVKTLASAKISDGWQISIVKEVRPHLNGAKPGDRLVFKLIGQTVVVEKESEK